MPKHHIINETHNIRRHATHTNVRLQTKLQRILASILSKNRSKDKHINYIPIQLILPYLGQTHLKKIKKNHKELMTYQGLHFGLVASLAPSA